MRHKIAGCMIFLLLAGSNILFTRCGATVSIKDLQVKAKIDSLVEIPRLTFEANQAIPTSFRSLTLSYGYTLRLTKDSLQCYLPYYGRAYTASYHGLDDAGIKFTSTDFELKRELTGKGAHLLTLIPRDTRKKLELYLTIQPTGYADLRVTDPERQPISFYGTIEY